MSTPDPTPDLIAWLRGVLDDDEAAMARIAASGVSLQIEAYSLDDDDADAWERICGPAAVLADIAAKRAILDLHHTSPDSGSSSHRVDVCEHCHWQMPCPTLRLLASAYRDRPEYRDEWRP